jgi:Ca2+ transporting ATPase
VLKQFEDLLVLILLGAAVVSFVLACFEDGEDQLTAFVEPAVILIILICNATVGVLQESNAEAALEKLKESGARVGKVIRNGKLSEIDAADVVPGDLITVDVGDKVPADARIIGLTSAVLSVDEAMLTGESDAANKHADVVKVKNAVNQDKRNMLFAGTLVVRGKALAVVTQTGANTTMGEIAKGKCESFALVTLICVLCTLSVHANLTIHLQLHTLQVSRSTRRTKRRCS